MEKPMVYLEEGGWGLTCGDDVDDPVWVEPGWYEAAPEDWIPYRDVEMIVFKADTEPGWNSLTSNPIALQGYDLDTRFVSWQIEDLPVIYSGTETILNQQPLPGTLNLDPHLWHLAPPHGLLALSYGESTDTHRGDLHDSSLET